MGFLGIVFPMKQSEILKVLSAELGTSKLEEVNKALKAKNFNTKFRITGPGFVHYGFTGLIKALTAEGVKVYNVNKVNLVSYADIDTFAKAVPRDERKKSPKPADAKNAKPVKKIEFEDDEDYENDDDFDELADEPDDIIEDDTVRTHFEKPVKDEFHNPKKKKKKNLHVSGSGSLFIPKKSK